MCRLLIFLLLFTSQSLSQSIEDSALFSLGNDTTNIESRWKMGFQFSIGQPSYSFVSEGEHYRNIAHNVSEKTIIKRATGVSFLIENEIFKNLFISIGAGADWMKERMEYRDFPANYPNDSISFIRGIKSYSEVFARAPLNLRYVIYRQKRFTLGLNAGFSYAFLKLVPIYEYRYYDESAFVYSENLSNGLPDDKRPEISSHFFNVGISYTRALGKKLRIQGKVNYQTYINHPLLAKGNAIMFSLGLWN